MIAVLTFAGTAELLGDARVDREAPASQEIGGLLDIAVRWIAICACVALVLYLSGLRVELTDGVLIAWFLFTPLVLWSGAISVRVSCSMWASSTGSRAPPSSSGSINRVSC